MHRALCPHSGTMATMWWALSFSFTKRPKASPRASLVGPCAMAAQEPSKPANGWIRHDVRDGHAEMVMNLVRHLVSIHDLAAGRMPGNNDRLDVREEVAAGDLAQDLVEEIERRHGRAVDSRSTRPPAIAIPADLVRCENITTSGAVARGHAWNDDERVLEGVGEKSGGERGAKVVVGVAPSAV